MKNTKADTRRYMEIHVLRPAPVSNPNRDECGMPKTAEYGGQTRARISSQCIKNAMREDFRSRFDEKDLGVRTKKLTALLAGKIAKISGSDDQAKNEELAKKALDYAGLKIEKDGTSKVLFFISDAQLTDLANLVLQGEKNSKKYQEALKAHPSIDMVLFGRMSADNKDLQVEAATEVSHAVSTHKIRMEQDFFAARDDMVPNGGAGMLDTTGYYSATLYEYMNIRLQDVIDIAGEDAPEMIRKIAESFIYATPSGKIHSYGQRTTPALVYVTFRKNPVTFMDAFEQPVKADRDGGFAAPSIARLNDFAGETYENFISEPDEAFVCLRGNAPSNLGKKVTMDEMSEAIEDIVKEIMNKEKES